MLETADRSMQLHVVDNVLRSMGLSELDAKSSEAGWGTLCDSSDTWVLVDSDTCKQTSPALVYKTKQHN
jgi:hypothetical protein